MWLGQIPEWQEGSHGQMFSYCGGGGGPVADKLQLGPRNSQIAEREGLLAPTRVLPSCNHSIRGRAYACPLERGSGAYAARVLS